MVERVHKIVVDENEIGKELEKCLIRISTEAIKARGRFTMGLSGGSMVKFVCNCLPSLDTDWTKWHLFFCDERLVPETDPESNFRLYKIGLIGKTPIEIDNFVLVDTDRAAPDAALNYEAKIRKFFPKETWPSFDLLLLGMGPDGHTASLFPNHPILEENTKWIAEIVDSPKPPPCRVTMTFPVINNAKNCLFIAVGAGKADMIKRILVDKEDLPSTRVKPNGHLYWILDKHAAKHC